MILSECHIGTKRNKRKERARRSELSPYISMWCGRRDLNPHSLGKRILSPLSFLCFQRVFRCSGILFPFQPEVTTGFVGLKWGNRHD